MFTVFRSRSFGVEHFCSTDVQAEGCTVLLRGISSVVGFLVGLWDIVYFPIWD